MTKPAVGAEPGVDPGLTASAEWLVAMARREGVPLIGRDGLLTELTKQVLQTALLAEMDDHLREKSSGPLGAAKPNSRNGATSKTLLTDVGEVTIAVPRDRAGTFVPSTVPKHLRRLGGFDDAVISLYAKGMSTGDIVNHLSEVYDTKVSREFVSSVTDAALERMTAWQHRTLNLVCPLLVIDAFPLKIRDGQGAERTAHVAIGIDERGRREVLGFRVTAAGNDAGQDLVSMLADLRERGVRGVRVVCCDGLQAYGAEVASTWSKAVVNTNEVMLVRRSNLVVAKASRQQLMADAIGVYSSPTRGEAEDRFGAFCDRWERDCPAIAERWRSSAADFVAFLAGVPAPVRQLIPATIGIDSLHERFRQATRRHGVFPSEQAAMKILYLTIIEEQLHAAEDESHTGRQTRCTTGVRTRSVRERRNLAR